MPTFEYRKLFRANISLKVEYKSLKEPPVTGAAISRNISPTGINIIMPDKLERGEELELYVFIYEKRKPVYARGKVIWVSECSYVPKSKKKYYSCGIQCTYMTAQDAISTSDFVREILKKEGDEQVTNIIERLEGTKR